CLRSQAIQQFGLPMSKLWQRRSVVSSGSPQLVFLRGRRYLMTEERDRIFISYRRSDAAGTTTALRKTLLERFEGQVFHDVTGIGLGASFPDELRKQLDRAVIVLAVIGKGWLEAANEFHQRRIDFPDDWVNIELSTALINPRVTVIPVLVDGTAMPPAKALPTELAELAARNAVHLRHDAWDETTRPLLEPSKKYSDQGAFPRNGPLKY